MLLTADGLHPVPPATQRTTHVLPVNVGYDQSMRPMRPQFDALTCIKAFINRVRCRVLLRPLAIEHVEPAVDGDSDSVGDRTTISISASASKISLG